MPNCNGELSILSGAPLPTGKNLTPLALLQKMRPNSHLMGSSSGESFTHIQEFSIREERFDPVIFNVERPSRCACNFSAKVQGGKIKS